MVYGATTADGGLLDGPWRIRMAYDENRVLRLTLITG